MLFYLLYRIGFFLANALPLNVSYSVACVIADAYGFVSRREKGAIRKNLAVILGGDRPDAETLEGMIRDVFRNFAKYLVDFFRFRKVDASYIKRYVRIEGAGNIGTALSKGRGAIIVSAHMGNWELGGFVMAVMGYPFSAVFLTHKNRLVDEFFTRQRLLSRMKPIKIGLSLRSCYSALKDNKLLALMGDRDFSGRKGIYMDFFGKRAMIPKGPSFFSLKLGSAIIPTFMIREKDDTFRLVFEKPIFPEGYRDDDKGAETITRQYLSVAEGYIRRYPTQWYLFKEIGEPER